MDRDIDHLNLLSIFYYIIAGLNLVGSFFTFFAFFIVGGVLMTAPNVQNGPPTRVLVPFMMVLVGFLVLLSLTSAALAFFTARFLKQRKYPVFCTVVAVLECLHFPLGTILGVFTILVLQRPRVQQMFRETSTIA